MPERAEVAAQDSSTANTAAVVATALLLYALVLGMEVGTSPRAHVPSVLVAIPAVLALAFGPAAIVTSALAVIATRWAFAATGLEPGRLGAAAGTMIATFATATVACCVVVTRARQEARLTGVASVAEAVQRALLRPPPAAVGDLRTAASYRAAERFAHLGGDLYAVADTAYGVRALIGDVRGSGLAAVATAGIVLGSFHESAYDLGTLDALADRVEVSLRRQPMDREAFVTALLVEIDADGRGRLLSCGHPPPLLLRGGQVMEVAVPARLPLGLSGLAPGPPEPAAVAETDLRPGDTLLMFTDGITEARDARGEFYPLAARLASAPCGAGAQALLAWLQDDVRVFAGGRAEDDAALLALTRPPSPGSRPTA